jgi:hypothetical protein
LLDAARYEYRTVYSNIYDLKRQEVYVYNQSNFDKVIKFNLADQLRKGKHFYKLCRLFPKNQKNYVFNYRKNYCSTKQKILIVFFIIVLLSPFIIWPISYFKRHRKSVILETSNPNKLFTLVARILAALNSIISLILLFYVIKYLLFIGKYGLNICGFIIGLLPIIMTILTVGEILILIIAWKRKYWRIKERIYYMLLILTAFIGILLFINLNYVVRL